ncbi:2-dehydropantoate 2-reductase [uncultured Algimonas sp.]|uniref:2-dehydropantoate 2-reductase n=1 Tax=uncultured Algimonas sp. TaxID=1547920 RepID=UPI00263746AB|nr:2-dehydropantoate 2-reductase [uncultured Algimonas sp.]
MNKPRITVLGAGSIGCYLGGRMMQGGAAVTLLGRERLAKVMAQKGLTLSAHGRATIHLDEVDFASDPVALAGSDIVALCVKSQDTADAAALIRQHAPTAWIVSFQNGISNLATLRDGVPDAVIGGAVVPFNVTSPGPGRFHRGTDGGLVIGPGAPEIVSGALRAAGVGVRIVDDIDAYLWAKLLVNLNNALNALSGGPLRDGLLQRGYRRVLIAMIEEGLAVAAAEDVDVATFNGRHPKTLIRLMARPDWLYRIVMDRIAKIDRTARSSMLDDLEAGRGPELDYLQGEIVRRAEAHGIGAPVNRAVMCATQDAFAQRKTPRLSGADMERLFLS